VLSRHEIGGTPAVRSQSWLTYRGVCHEDANQELNRPQQPDVLPFWSVGRAIWEIRVKAVRIASRSVLEQWEKMLLLRILRKQMERLAAIIRTYLTLDHNKLPRLADLQSDFYYLRAYNWPAMNGSIKRQELIRELHEKIGFDLIIETGTFCGATTEFFTDLKPPTEVRSVELSEILYEFSKWRLRGRNNCHLYKGNSDEVLRSFDPADHARRCLFYLDAHWSTYLPLRAELKACAQWGNAVVMIDDFQVEDDPGFGFDDYGDNIGRLTLNYIADLIDDCDVFFPGFSSAVDKSRKTRGFVMLSRNSEISSKMRDCPFLREYEK
jgi:hypothetical protein